MIHVTKPFLPPFEEYKELIEGVFKREWLTNNGPLVQELEVKLRKKLAIPFLNFCGNGTVVLQIALKALNITGEVITTPFSYVATTSAILWENCKPVFVDINEKDFNIDVELIESKITNSTQAILATHVYGNPCDVEAIEALANKYNLKVIYDAAHAFGVTYKGKSLLGFGDISTCSFHATKIFHTVEGGAITCNNAELNKIIVMRRSFGHIGDDHFLLGINGKNSEMHAAMGICNLKYFDSIKEERKQISKWYKEELGNLVQYPEPLDGTDYNYSYFPIALKDEATLLKVIGALAFEEITPRRYFYPSLNNLPYLDEKQPCPIAESVSLRALSLPLYFGLAKQDVLKITSIIKSQL